jgi:hypothetical protein
VTTALPLPYAFDVIVIQPALLVAVHAQVEFAVTAMLPLAAAGEDSVDEEGEIAGVHAELNANVSDRALEATSSGPTAFTTASYTTPRESGIVSKASRSTRIFPSGSGDGLPRSIVCSIVLPPAR